MSKMIFNGLEFVAGQEINNNGMFVDTSNVIVPTTTFTSSMSYTATSDCIVALSLTTMSSSSVLVKIDGVIIQSGYIASGNNSLGYSVNIKKGQVLTISGANSSSNSAYTVYGLQSGSISNVQHNYSTSEQLIGTWIDGKPLYEKTIVANSTDISGTIQHIDVSALNIDTFVKIDGTFNRITAGSAHRIYPFNAYESSSYYSFVRYLVEEKEIGFNITMASGQSTTQQVFTLQYTKTTD